MDFTLPPEHEALRQQVRSFIAEEVLPLEADPANYDAHENIRIDLLDSVRAKAKAAIEPTSTHKPVEKMLITNELVNAR